MACLMVIFSAKRGKIDICIYSNSFLPYRQTHCKSKKEEDIKSPSQKNYKVISQKKQNKTKLSKLGMSPLPNFLFLFNVGILFFSPLNLSSWKIPLDPHYIKLKKKKGFPTGSVFKSSLVSPVHFRQPGQCFVPLTKLFSKN